MSKSWLFPVDASQCLQRSPVANACVLACVRTTGLWEPSSVDLILHHICPVEQAVIKVEVQGDGVPQPRHQQAVVSLVKVYPSYLVSDWENYKRLKGIWMKKETATKILLGFFGFFFKNTLPRLCDASMMSSLTCDLLHSSGHRQSEDRWILWCDLWHWCCSRQSFQYKIKSRLRGQDLYLQVSRV